MEDNLRSFLLQSSTTVSSTQKANRGLVKEDPDLRGASGVMLWPQALVSHHVKQWMFQVCTFCNGKI